MWGYPEGEGTGTLGDMWGTGGLGGQLGYRDARDMGTRGFGTCVGTRWAQGHRGHPGHRGHGHIHNHSGTHRDTGDTQGSDIHDHAGMRGDTLGMRDTPGTGTQRAQGCSRYGDTWAQRAQPGAGHAGMCRDTPSVPRVSPCWGGGSPGVLWLRQRVQGAGLLFHSPQFHQGALSTDRGGSGATRGPRWGSHGEGATAGGYAAHPMVPLSAQHRAASRARPCGTAVSAQSSARGEGDRPWETQRGAPRRGVEPWGTPRAVASGEGWV